jgi:hypothetical protein
VSAAVPWPALALVACGIATFLLARRSRTRVPAGLGLLAVLAGFFLLFVAVAPGASGGTTLPTVLFFGALSVFKLMNRFEAR